MREKQAKTNAHMQLAQGPLDSTYFYVIQCIHFVSIFVCSINAIKTRGFFVGSGSKDINGYLKEKSKIGEKKSEVTMT